MAVKRMTRSALLLATLCVAAQITIPIPALPVPLSLGMAGLYLAALLQRPRECALTVGAYLIIGAIGLPVFAGFNGGIATFAGPTGGYLMAYLPACVLGSCIQNRAGSKGGVSGQAVSIAAMLAMTAVIYAAGSAWLCVLNGLPYMAALAVGALPFLPLDIVKMGICLVVQHGWRRTASRMMDA